MKTKEKKSIESYYQTKDENFNDYAFELYLDIIKTNTFDNPEIPLSFYHDQVNKIPGNAQHPSKAVDLFLKEFNQVCKTEEQKLMMFDYVIGYLETSKFADSTEQVQTILNAHYKKLKDQVKGPDPEQFKTKDLREKLKSTMLNELDKLPELLEGMKEKERLDVIIKMMPFVFPKVQNVSASHGEGFW